MRKYLAIYEEAVSHICLYNRSLLNFLIYEENFILFFISVHHSIADEGYTTVAVSKQDFSAGKLKYSALFNNVFEAWAY